MSLLGKKKFGDKFFDYRDTKGTQRLADKRKKQLQDVGYEVKVIPYKIKGKILYHIYTRPVKEKKNSWKTEWEKKADQLDRMRQARERQRNNKK
jgi:hypothetical protein